MIDEEHAVARDILSDDDVCFLENLVLQFEEDGVDKALISVLKDRHVSQQPAAHHCHNLLKNTHE